MQRSQTALVVDGSLARGCVALLTLSGSASGTLTVAEVGTPPRSHLERIADLLPSSALRRELCAIVVGVGPGSYTGIRAASAAAAGVAVALQLPTICVPSDRALYSAAAECGGDVVVLPLGTREVLVIHGLGSTVVPHESAPESVDLERVAERLPHAFASLAAAGLREAIDAAARGEAPRQSEIKLHYPSPPRGALGGVPRAT